MFYSYENRSDSVQEKKMNKGKYILKYIKSGAYEPYLATNKP